MLKSGPAFILALIVALAVLEIIKATKPQYAWGYIVILILGMLAYNRFTVNAFLADVQARIQ